MSSASRQRQQQLLLPSGDLWCQPAMDTYQSGTSRYITRPNIDLQYVCMWPKDRSTPDQASSTAAVDGRACGSAVECTKNLNPVVWPSCFSTTSLASPVTCTTVDIIQWLTFTLTIEKQWTSSHWYQDVKKMFYTMYFWFRNAMTHESFVNTHLITNWNVSIIILCVEYIMLSIMCVIYPTML